MNESLKRKGVRRNFDRTGIVPKGNLGIGAGNKSDHRPGRVVGGFLPVGLARLRRMQTEIVRACGVGSGQ